MKIELITFHKLYREVFQHEEFTETDDIFLLLISGSFSLEADGKKYTVSAGQGVLFRKGVKYLRRVISPVTLCLFRYRSDEQIFKNDYVLFHDTERIRSTIRILDTLEFKHPRQELALHIFYDIIYQYEMQKSTQVTNDAVIEAVLKKIESSPYETSSLSVYASESGLSYAQFHRRFKEYTGKSPSNYVIRLKLNCAREMLINTKYTVREIALRCGFDNEYYFSNFFKKHEGVSPSVFRSLSL